MINGVQAGGSGHTRPTAQEIFKKLDTNGDGSIDIDELSAAKGGKAGKGEDAKTRMARFDTNGDGKIDASENEAAMARMDEEIKNRVKGTKHKGCDGDGGANEPGGSQAADQNQTLASLLDLLKRKSASGDGSDQSDSLLSQLQTAIQTGTQYTDSGAEKCSVQQGPVNLKG